MITDFDSISTNMARLALSMYAQEQLYLSNNIANANTPGYLPKGLDFEKVYSELSNLELSNAKVDVAEIKSIKNNISDDDYVLQHNENVDLNNELLKMTQNTVKYKVMLSALKSKGEFMKLVLQSK